MLFVWHATMCYIKSERIFLFIVYVTVLLDSSYEYEQKTAAISVCIAWLYSVHLCRRRPANVVQMPDLFLLKILVFKFGVYDEFVYTI